MTPVELIKKTAHAFIDDYVQTEGCNAFLTEVFTLMKNSPSTNYTLIAYGSDTVIETACLETEDQVLYLNRSSIGGDEVLAYTAVASPNFRFDSRGNLDTLLDMTVNHVIEKPFND